MPSQRTRSIWYKVGWIYTLDFPGREIPLVYLSDGKPGYVINQWIYYLVEEEMSPSTLDYHVRALCHFYEFTMAMISKYGCDYKIENLMADFIDAKRYGTDGECIKLSNSIRHEYLINLNLNWKATSRNNIISYIRAIDKFDEWQTLFHGAPTINPMETKVMSLYEIYKDFKSREKWDPFLHLHNTRHHSQNEHKSTALPKYEHHRKSMEKRITPKAFPLDKCVDLVDGASNPRDKMLVLLMMGTSLRMSETLHILLPDIEGVDEMGQSRIRLADPETGKINWIRNGEFVDGSRSQYFYEMWKNEMLPKGHPLRNLQPRTMYGRPNKLFSGWKGQTYSESDGNCILKGIADGREYDLNYVWWINPQLGAYFHTCYLQYMENYIWQNPFTGKRNANKWPFHPWLFVKLDKDGYGMPLTICALRKIWKRLLRQTELEDIKLSWHSLRHLFGYYCANVLKLPLEITQALMHHASIQSTKVYYSLDRSTVREVLIKAISNYNGIPQSILIDDNPPLQFPSHWTNKFLNQYIKTKGKRIENYYY